MSNFNVNGNGKEFDVKKLIQQAEVKANGENSEYNNGKIDRPGEQSVFTEALRQAVVAGEITEADATNVMDEVLMIKRGLPDVQVTGKRTFWDKAKKPLLIAGAVLAGAVGVVATVLTGGAAAGALPVLGKLGLGALAAAGILSLTSCGKEQDIYNINTNVNNFDFGNIVDKLEDIHDEIRRGRIEQKEAMDKLKEQLDEIKSHLGDLNAILQNIYQKICNIANNQELSLAKIDALAVILQTILDNQETFSADLGTRLSLIMEKLDQMDDKVAVGFASVVNGLADNKDVLLNILNEVLSGNDKMEAILNKLGQMDEVQRGFFMTALTNIQQILGNQENLYNLGLEILNKLDIQPGQAPDYTELLNAILDKLNNIDANTSAIIDNINNLNEDMLEGIQNIMNNANSNTREIIAAMDAGKAELALILQGLRADVQGLDQEVLDKLTQIIANQNTQIDNQGHIIANQEATGQVLNQIKLVIDAILAKLNNEFPQIRELLQGIYNKIPAGCHCQSIDLTAVIELLNEIIEKIGNGNGNDEGVLNELEEELGIS